MVVALWRRRNRCGAAMDVQALRRRPTSILRYRFASRDLLRDAALRLAFGQRRHRGHRRTRRPGRDRRLILLVATAEADIGQALEQRQPGLLRGLFLDLAAGLTNFGIRGVRAGARSAACGMKVSGGAAASSG